MWCISVSRDVLVSWGFGVWASGEGLGGGGGQGRSFRHFGVLRFGMDSGLGTCRFP